MLRSNAISASTFFASSIAALALIAACSSDETTTPGGKDGGADTGTRPDGSTGGGPDGAADTSTTCANPGGPVTGAADAHCKLADGGTRFQETSAAACSPDGGHSHEGDAAAEEGDGGEESEYGETMNGAEADDDDCKYHLKWSVTPVCANSDVTFTLTVTKTSDGKPLQSAPIRLEVFKDETHPVSTAGVKVTEGASGTYTVGPVRFDAAGKWTVRFHFFEQCTDLLEESPHGHAAFFVDVP